MNTLDKATKRVQPRPESDQGHRSKLDALLHFAAIRRGEKAFRDKSGVLAKLGPGGWEWVR